MSHADFPDFAENEPKLRRYADPAILDNASRFRGTVPGVRRFALRAQPTWDTGDIPPPDSTEPSEGTLSRGRRGPSGGRTPDGQPFRTARGRGDHDGPCFDIAVPPNGYAWWYVDGVSDDGERAISIIGFIGSVFSPWYRWSGRKRPENHCCLNVVTYGRGGRWTMTDRGESALRLSESRMEIGPSSMSWDGDTLVIDVDEMTTPHPGKLQGQIRLKPTGVTNIEVPLKNDGSHVWRPFAPTARIDVDLNRKGWQWSGHGYFDANFGTAALEDDFSYWTWSRMPVRGGSAAFYDAERRDGSSLAVALKFAENGEVEPMVSPPRQRVSRSLWAVRRETRSDEGSNPRQIKAMLDAPFYTRSVVRTTIHGEETDGVHEALDLNRFASPLLKPMLAVRVPRRKNWTFRD